MESLIVVKGWISAHIPAVIGSGISLLVSKEKTKAMRKIELFLVFFSGILISYYLGGWVIEYFSIPLISPTADAIKFTIGLIGMAVVANVTIQIPLILEAIRKKWLGA